MARILHLSDWHVGATLYRADRTADHRAVLEETVAIAREQAPDLILHTGDVFETLMPGFAHQQLAVGALQSLAEIAPTIVIAGNHDSPHLFRVFAMLLRDQPRLRFVPTARPPEQGGIIDVTTGANERIRVAPVPFVHHNRFVDFFGEDQRRHATYADQMRRVNERLGRGLQDGFDGSTDVLVYAAHLHLTGAILAGSERRVHVTEDWAADPSTLPPVAYTALGHIHKPQELGGSTGAYAGSALQLDFGERGQAKRVVVVDAVPGKPAQLTSVPLTTGRCLAQLEGTLDVVRDQARAITDEIVKVVIECEEPTEGIVDEIRGWMPEATVVEVVEDAANRRLQAAHDSEDAAAAEPTLPELFDEFLTENDTRGAVSAEGVRSLYRALSDAQEAEAERPTVEDLPDLLECELPVPPGTTASVTG